MMNTMSESNDKTRKAASSAGFTLMEMLVVVGIMVVMLAIAIPSIGSLSRSLTMTRLDNYAKEIYVSAQNSLITLKAGGQLSSLDKTLETDYGKQKLGNVGTKPSDYQADDDGWQSYYYLDSGDAAMDTIMGTAIISKNITDKGVYIIEFEPTSGGMYAVFYSEDPDFGYDDVLALQSREQSSRFEDLNGYPVGYYVGGDASPISYPDSFKPTTTLVNDEELYLNIQCPTSVSMTSVQRYMTITVTIKDSYSQAKTITLKGGQDFELDAAGNIDVDVLLDSMREGYSYKDITGLEPGLDFTATVSVEFSHSGTSITTNQADIPTATGNSLFESISTDNGTNTVNISKVRHLNNLRAGYVTGGVAFSTFNQTANIDFDASTWSATSLSAATVAYNKATYGSTTGILNPLDPRTTTGALGFLPLTSEKASGSNWYNYNGNGNLLSNFFIQGTGDATWTAASKAYIAKNFGTDATLSTSTGLFGLRQGTLTGVRLVDPTVIGSSSTGALAGNLSSGASVSDCGVYLSTADASGTAYDADTMAKRVATYTVTASSGSTAVGGLIGTVGGTVSQSFAAIDVKAVSGSISQAGGLVGALTSGGSTIATSYASGTVTASTIAGGLVGYLSSSSQNTISSCYASGNVNVDTYGGGLIGQANTNSAAVLSSQSYGQVLTLDGGIDAATSGGMLGASLQGTQWWKPVQFTNCSYLMQTGYNTGFTTMEAWNSDGKLTGESYTALATGTLSSTNSHPYSGDLFGRAFPFVQIKSGTFTQTSHYGNWPMRAGMNPTLLYYEKYLNTNGTYSYGYYGTTTLTDQDANADPAVIDTLRSADTMTADGSYLVEDGYAFMTSAATSNMYYSINGGTDTLVSAGTTADANTMVQLDSTGLFYTQGGESTSLEGVYVYQLPYAAQENSHAENASFYDQLNITLASSSGKDTVTYTYYYNPAFAKTAINLKSDGTASDKPAKGPTTVSVRSARQLNLLGRSASYWNTNGGAMASGTTFQQEIDIDYGHYVTTYCGVAFNLLDSSGAQANVCIGRADNAFVFNFDGGNHTIVDYNLETTQQFAGMFGQTTSNVIRNVHMVASTSGGAHVRLLWASEKRDETPALGALVGLAYRNDDTDVAPQVINCSVTGYEVTLSYDNKSDNHPNGVINQNCAIGGMVGFNMGTITNCSAVNAVVQLSSSADNATLVSIGGLAGVNGGAITACYTGGSLTYVAPDGYGASIYRGGIAGRYYRQSTSTNLASSFTDCYSFCSAEVVSSKYSNTAYHPISTSRGSSKGTAGNNGPSTVKVTFTDNYYLLPAGTTASTSGAGAATQVTAAQLTALATTGKLAQAGFGVATNTLYPYDSTGSFPYPAIVKNSAGQLVHYGSWVTQ